MNIALFLLLTTTAILSRGDVIRTVFCRTQCSDYLRVPESSMPLCAPGHFQLKECGTVVICDWSEADRDKVRPMANSSDVLCCYQTTTKQKGDCVEQLVTEKEPVQVTKSFFALCGFHFLSWFPCIAIIAIVVLQAAYIVKLRISGPKHRKVSQSDEMRYPQAVVTQPLVDIQHSRNTMTGRDLCADELSSGANQKTSTSRDQNGERLC